MTERTFKIKVNSPNEEPIEFKTKTFTSEEVKTIHESISFFEKTLQEKQKKFDELQKKYDLLFASNENLAGDLFVEREVSKKRDKEKDLRISDLRNCVDILEKLNLEKDDTISDYELIAEDYNDLRDGLNN